MEAVFSTANCVQQAIPSAETFVLHTDLKHLHNVETRGHFVHTFLSLDFQCRDEVSLEFKYNDLGLKRAGWAFSLQYSVSTVAKYLTMKYALPHQQCACDRQLQGALQLLPGMQLQLMQCNAVQGFM